MALLCTALCRGSMPQKRRIGQKYYEVVRQYRLKRHMHCCEGLAKMKGLGIAVNPKI